ncbi:ComF family protein [Leptodesmis sp.]|uniref:ComF family protein n=1 Tax=Leptodesmis sp. TaxID=3100501 RepID=UPI0040535229
MKGLRRLLDRGLKVLLESPCPLCQRSAPTEICNTCQRRIMACQVTPTWDMAENLPVFAWGVYSGALKQAIAALKYDNQPHLAYPLGAWMGSAWNCAHPVLTPAIVVPIPMHISKQRERGFNQAALLARSFCQATRLPLKVDGLERQRATAAQFTLSNLERQQNLQAAFCLGRALLHQRPSQPILLLDDIYTTGATAQAAAKTLRDRGFQVKGIVVLARAMRIR